MAWKKRKKYSLSTFSFFCISCGLVYLCGSMVVLHSEFLHVYEATARALRLHRDKTPTRLVAPAQGDGQSHTLQLHDLSDLLIELPSGALKVDAPLRKLLMQRSSREIFQQRFVEPGKPDQRVLTSNVVHLPHEDVVRTLAQTSKCSIIRNISDWSYLASGWTKAVYSGRLGKDKPVAIKTVDTGGQEMTTCLGQLDTSRSDTKNSPASSQKRGYYKSLNTPEKSRCYAKASHKLMKEILVLKALNHPNIIEVFDFCVPERTYDGSSHSLLTMVTELGESIDIIKLLQMSWEDRLRVAYGITKLLHYLAKSPLGSIALNDFRRQQFVLVGGELKLTDIDDAGYDDPSCVLDSECVQHFSSTNFTVRTRCRNNKCLGFNEKKNVFNAARHFTTFLLPHGAPLSLKRQIDTIVSGYSNSSMTSGQLLKHMDNLVQSYKTGTYLGRRLGQRKSVYKRIANSDLPGQFDYRCRYSIASSGCTLSVFDQYEAEEFCDNDPECKAFIMSSEKTWAGRTFIHLKNGFTEPSDNQLMDLYVKPHVPT